MTAIIALDIETVSTTEDPDFNDPSAWSPFAIALAARSDPSATPTTRVILRDSADDHGARKLLAAATNWMQAAIPATSDAGPTLTTYNGRADARPGLGLGRGYDLPILDHMADTTRRNRPQHQTLEATWNLVLDRLTHRDLFAELVERRGRDAEYLALEAACEDHDIPIETPRCEGRVIDGAACAELGRAVMDGSITDAERDALIKYSRQDARVLVDLADALDREQRAEQEADAVADGGEP